MHLIAGTGGAGQLADFVNATAPALIGGLLALAGTIVLFWLQQAAQRRAARAERLEVAFEKVVAMTYHLRAFAKLKATGEDAGMPAPEDFTRTIWELVWLLRPREISVAAWLLDKLEDGQALIEATPPGQQAKVGLLCHEMILGLVMWKTGQRRLKWFREHARGIGLPAGPTTEEADGAG